ncbi:MAG TPA: hypothetical protein VKR83_08520 [Ktedonobacteraceae bacterium]|nr:hypothetical protein [Ktedonobacteraceae bacterium]
MPRRQFSLIEKQHSLPEQDAINRVPKPIQIPWLRLLKLARNPEAEAYYSAQDATGAQFVTLGWLPLLALTSASGILLVAYAFGDSRAGGTAWLPFFFGGLLLIFVLPLLRLISAAPSRFERIGLICMVGLACYLIKVIASPLYFSFYDEFLHWRTVSDIASSGHLFSENALLPVSPYYPGLEIVTNALASLSGLDSFTSGLIVIGCARLLMIVSLFALYEQLMKSSRIASIAVMIYMANPHFLLFDAQYGYESLALPLATFVMFAMSPHQKVSVRLARLLPMAPFVMFAKERHKWLKSDLRWLTLTAWIALAALAMTHHVTDFFLVGLLLAWAIIYACMRLIPLRRSNLVWSALFAALVALLSTMRAGNPVIGYLFSFMGESFKELGGVLTGTGASRQLFVTYAGQATPLWERIVTLSSVGLIVLSLPFGLLCLWQRYRSNALTFTFGTVALFYPVSQLFRLTTSGAELTDRSAPFLFIPIAAVMAICLVQFWPLRSLNRKQSALLTCAVSLVFFGGVMLGTGPSETQLPGAYEVIADARSIEPEGIQAALWAQLYLGPDNRVATDRINQILMGSYGNQRIVSTIADSIDVSPVFLSSQFGPEDIAILRKAGVRYLVVDLRLAQSLPLSGYYYEQFEDGAYNHTSPIAMQALTKFSAIAQINRVFDSGDIVVYDVGGLINAPETP